VQRVSPLPVAYAPIGMPDREAHNIPNPHKAPEQPHIPIPQEMQRPSLIQTPALAVFRICCWQQVWQRLRTLVTASELKYSFRD
jgi:hypothetical protein